MQAANHGQPTPASFDEPLAATLKLIMQHSSTWDPQDLCRLLQVSSSCRQTLQQSRGKCDVMLDFGQLNFKARCKLQGFAEWMSSHAGLLSSFAWAQPADSDSPEHQQELQQELQLMQRQLAWAMQMCRRLRAAAGSAAAAAGAAGDAPSEPQALPLQLTAAFLGCSWPEPQLLRELAAAGLQELRMCREPTHPSPSYYTCFTTLSSLQRLSIFPAFTTVHSAGFMSAVQRLSSLTSLELGVVAADTAQQLPPQLEGLTTMFAAGSSGSTVVSLTHLAALRQLDCFAAADGVERLEVLLPRNLTCLNMSNHMVATDGNISRITGASAALKQASVQRLEDTDINVLVHVCSLPVLRSLDIQYSSFSTPEASEVAVAALGSATALTRLNVYDVRFAGGVGVCRQLAKLPRLVDLHLWSFSVPGVGRDWLCLTALTSLAKLTLQDPGEQLDDVVAAALAHHLTGLRQLWLSSKSISSLALLPAVGALTGLSSLRLRGGKHFVVGPDDLKLLSGLTGLESLTVRRLKCSKAEQQQFLAGMPHLTAIAPV